MQRNGIGGDLGAGLAVLLVGESRPGAGGSLDDDRDPGGLEPLDRIRRQRDAGLPCGVLMRYADNDRRGFHRPGSLLSSRAAARCEAVSLGSRYG